MLGLSISKLALLILLVAVVWFGVKYLNRFDAVRQALREERRRRGSRSPQPADAEDLVKCSSCGAYVVSRSALACGRADCPWAR
jgi:uncharacterized protein